MNINKLIMWGYVYEKIIYDVMHNHKIQEVVVSQPFSMQLNY